MMLKNQVSYGASYIHFGGIILIFLLMFMTNIQWVLQPAGIMRN